jgi:hypothetical protein
VLSGSLVALAIAATLQPSDSGMGTHRQLGYPSCLWPVLTGYPCPTCGMTTAFAFAVRGRFGSALLAQPAGLVAAIATMLAAVLSVDVIVTGRAWSVNGYRLRPDRVAMGVLAVVAAGWAFKLVVVWWARSWSGGP